MSPALLIAEHSKLNGLNPSAALSTTFVKLYPCARAGAANDTNATSAASKASPCDAA
jgi:hypothetical protein